MIKISPEATKYIENFLKKENKSSLYVSVVKGGCSGMQYKFQCVDEAKNSEIIEFENFKVFIDNNAVLFVINTQLSYQKTETGIRLFFENPNEKNRCGCGKSFNF